MKIKKIGEQVAVAGLYSIVYVDGAVRFLGNPWRAERRTFRHHVRAADDSWAVNKLDDLASKVFKP